jgi:hypothetical protein
LHHYYIHNPYLSLAITIDLKRYSREINCGIFQQKSSKEMGANYEVLFDKAQNQLSVAKINCNLALLVLTGSFSPQN